MHHVHHRTVCDATIDPEGYCEAHPNAMVASTWVRDAEPRPLTPTERRVLGLTRYLRGSVEVQAARRLEARGLAKLNDYGIGPNASDGTLGSDERWTIEPTEAGRALLGARP